MVKKMSTKTIRVRAAAVILMDNRILAHVVQNSDDGKTWFIPPGGGLQYGESSTIALRREIKEELEWDISIERLFGCFESCHTINGVDEHEISFVYEAKPCKGSTLSFAKREIVEDNGTKKTFQWIELKDLAQPQHLLYPEGLLEKIKARRAGQYVVTL